MFWSFALSYSLSLRFTCDLKDLKDKIGIVCWCLFPRLQMLNSSEYFEKCFNAKCVPQNAKNYGIFNVQFFLIKFVVKWQNGQTISSTICSIRTISIVFNEKQKGIWKLVVTYVWTNVLEIVKEGWAWFYCLPWITLEENNWVQTPPRANWQINKLKLFGQLS